MNYNEAFARDILAANIAAGNDPYNLEGGAADPGILAAAGLPASVTQQPGALSFVPQGTERENIGVVRPGQPSQRSMAALTTPIPQMPDRQIGLNESLIRIGGAGARGAAKGGLESIGAMTDQFGAIEDYNRSRALEEYNAALNAYKAETARNKANKPIATKGLSAKDQAEREAEIGQIDQTLSDMDGLIAKLEPGGVTGFFDTWIAGIYDKAAGDKDRVTRLALLDLKVDATLLKTAQTKGAISDSEMKLFQSPTPSIDDQETVWIEWIKKRQEALRKVRERLAGGTTVDQPASAEQVDQFANQMTGGNISAADAIVSGL